MSVIFGPYDNANQVNSPWVGYTMRFIIPAAQLLVNASSFIIRFEYSTFNWAFAKCYIGHAAASGDVYDFESAPTQVLFGGQAAGSINGADLLSDVVARTLDKTKPLILTVYFASSAGDDIPRRDDSTGYGVYYKSGDDCTTVNASGYSASTFNGQRHAVAEIYTVAEGLSIPIAITTYRKRRT